jgi:hypothetical protein
MRPQEAWADLSQTSLLAAKMKHQVKLLEEAEQCLAALPPFLQEFVTKQLLTLGDSPSLLSRPVVSPPFPPIGGMIYEFMYEIGQEVHNFTVFFRYSQDELSLVVTFIGHTDLQIGPSS